MLHATSTVLIIAQLFIKLKELEMFFFLSIYLINVFSFTRISAYIYTAHLTSVKVWQEPIFTLSICNKLIG